MKMGGDCGSAHLPTHSKTELSIYIQSKLPERILHGSSELTCPSPTDQAYTCSQPWGLFVYSTCRSLILSHFLQQRESDTCKEYLIRKGNLSYWFLGLSPRLDSNFYYYGLVFHPNFVCSFLLPVLFFGVRCWIFLSPCFHTSVSGFVPCGLLGDGFLLSLSLS